MFKEFKSFIARGNVIDLAVGVVIGTAFSKIVNSLVNDVIMPPIGLVLGRVNFSNLYINLSRHPYANLQEAKAAGAPTINYGAFLNTVIDFLIVAIVIFVVVNQFERLRRARHPEVVATVRCPYCDSAISPKAIRCPHCTSELIPDESGD